MECSGQLTRSHTVFDYYHSFFRTMDIPYRLFAMCVHVLSFVYCYYIYSLGVIAHQWRTNKRFITYYKVFATKQSNSFIE